MFDPMLADWVVETSTTTGTGAYALGGAPAGTSYFIFRQRIGNGDPVAFYFVRNAGRTKWELNVTDWAGAAFCTLTHGTPDSLARNVVKSTNGDAAVSWVSGDLPLRVYMAPFSALWEAIVSGHLADAIGDLPWLRHGEWFRDNYPATDWVQKYLYDGTGSGIALGKYHKTARKWVPDKNAITYPPGYIQGLTYANSSGDATNDITISPGVCAATSVYPMVLEAALTKRLDAAWAVGDNEGGLDTGSIGNNDYFIWLIGRSDTGVVDVLFSLSATAPTMPADYDYRRLIGWFKRSGGSIVPFTTYEVAGGGLYFSWTTKRNDVSLSATLGTTRRLDGLSTPSGVNVAVKLIAASVDNSVNATVYVGSPDDADELPGGQLRTQVSAVQVLSQLEVVSNASGQVASKASETITTFNIITLGFTWSRR